MTRTRARITQADVARAVRAAKQAGASGVRVLPDGTIQIDLQATILADKQEIPIAPDPEIVL